MALVAQGDGAPFVWLLNRSSALLLRMLGVRQGGEHALTAEELHMIFRRSDPVGRDRGRRAPDHDRDHAARRPSGARTDDAAHRARLDRPQAPARRHPRRDQGYAAFAAAGGRWQPDNIVGVVKVREVLALLLQAKGSDRPADAQGRSHPRPARRDGRAALLQQSDVAMALVHDEYGHLEGVVTPADLLDAIVGNFASHQDEGDEPMVVEREDGSLLVAGAMPADAMADRLGIELPDEPRIRDGRGLCAVGDQACRKEGEHFEDQGWRFEVVDMDGLQDRQAAGQRGCRSPEAPPETRPAFQPPPFQQFQSASQLPIVRRLRFAAVAFGAARMSRVTRPWRRVGAGIAHGRADARRGLARRLTCSIPRAARGRPPNSASSVCCCRGAIRWARGAGGCGGVSAKSGGTTSGAWRCTANSSGRSRLNSPLPPQPKAAPRRGQEIRAGWSCAWFSSPKRLGRRFVIRLFARKQRPGKDYQDADGDRGIGNVEDQERAEIAEMQVGIVDHEPNSHRSRILPSAPPSTMASATISASFFLLAQQPDQHDQRDPQVSATSSPAHLHRIGGEHAQRNAVVVRARQIEERQQLDLVPHLPQAQIDDRPALDHWSTRRWQRGDAEADHAVAGEEAHAAASMPPPPDRSVNTARRPRSLRAGAASSARICGGWCG
jgi:hypothetical protein